MGGNGSHCQDDEVSSKWQVGLLACYCMGQLHCSEMEQLCRSLSYGTSHLLARYQAHACNRLAQGVS